MKSEIPSRSALASLRRFVKPRASTRARCELCSAEIADEHAHVLELASRRLSCTCEPCAILFSSPEAAKYRRVRRRIEYLPDFCLTDVQWQGLQLPINLAFFLHSTAAERVVALYPSPGGATEALPPTDAWDAVVDDNPILRKLEPDVEALLANRLGANPEHYVVGIDECYALVGVVRTHWRGMTGGPKMWGEIADFFAGLRQRSRPIGATPHA